MLGIQRLFGRLREDGVEVDNISMDLEFTILLPGGGVFRFAGPFPVSCGQWEHIRAVMDVMAPGLITGLPFDPSHCERFETAIEASPAPDR
jgi:hypothetical protein